MQDRKSQPGNILLYTMLVVAVILTSVVLVTNFVVSRLKQASYLQSYHRAYYAAESGAEKYLYSIRKHEYDFVKHQSGIACDISEDSDVSELACVIDAELETINQINIPVLEKDKSFEFEVVNIDVAGDPRLVPSELKKAEISWNGGQNVIGSVEMSYQKRIDDGGANYSKALRLSSSDARVVWPLVDSFFNEFNNYKVKAKALNEDLIDVRVELFKDSEGTVPLAIPDLLSVDAIGREGDSRQVINVRFFTKSPTSDLFDYVLFSDKALIK